MRGADSWRRVWAALTLASALAGTLASADAARPLPGQRTRPTPELVFELADGKLWVSRGSVRAELPAAPDSAYLKSARSTASEVIVTLTNACEDRRSVGFPLKAVEARLEESRGVQLQGEGRLDEAEQHFFQAIELDPSFVRAALHLASVRLARGERDQALTVLRSMLQTKPMETYVGLPEVPALVPLLDDPSVTSLHPPPGDARIQEHDLFTDWMAYERGRGVLAAATDELVFMNARTRRLVATLTLVGPDERDGNDEILPSARTRIAERVAWANRLLAELGFTTPKDLEVGEIAQGPGTSRVLYPKARLELSPGNHHEVLLLHGKRVTARARLQAHGTVGLDWGVYLPSEHIVFFRWSRRSGPDACGAPYGVEILPTPDIKR